MVLLKRPGSSESCNMSSVEPKALEEISSKVGDGSRFAAQLGHAVVRFVLGP